MRRASAPPAAQSGQTVVAGIRPESFEDASLVPDDARDRGTTFKTKIDLVESLGAEKYAYFQSRGVAGRVG